jgi:plasmid stabilization system protein ParE
LGRRHIADYAVERIGKVVAERCVRKAQNTVLTIARTLEGEQA